MSPMIPHEKDSRMRDFNNYAHSFSLSSSSSSLKFDKNNKSQDYDNTDKRNHIHGNEDRKDYSRGNADEKRYPFNKEKSKYYYEDTGKMPREARYNSRSIHVEKKQNYHSRRETCDDHFPGNKGSRTERDNEPQNELEILKLMGFSSFSSTKGQHVAGSDLSAVEITPALKYRQYMNRRNGFNKPLEN